MGDYLDKTANPEEGDETYQGGGESQTEGEFGYVELAAEGWYEVIVTAAIYGTSKNSGAAQWTLSLACPELPQAAAKYYLTNAPGSQWRVEQDLKTFGLEPPVKGEKPKKYVADDFIGKKVEAQGKHDFYQGRKNFKFTAIRPTAEGPGARAYQAA